MSTTDSALVPVNMYIDSNFYIDDDQYMNQEVRVLEMEIHNVKNENSKLRHHILELKATCELEVSKRLDVETNVKKILNSPGAATDQLMIYAEKVKILEKITDLQSSLIDKNFIVSQNEVIKDLRSRFDDDESDAGSIVHDSRDVHDTCAEPCQSMENTSDVSTVDNHTVHDSSPPTVDNHNVHDPSSPTVDNHTVHDSSSLSSLFDDFVTVDNIDTDTAHVNAEGKTRPPKFYSGYTHVVYNSKVVKPTVLSSSVMDLVPNEQERVTRFSRALERLRDLPQHVNTLIITDSNGHNIKGRQLDPNGRTWLISSGGLCVNAAVHSLQQLSDTHTGISRVVYCLGLNDELHKRQHVKGQRGSYLSSLGTVTSKVFPNASMSFVLPCAGGKMSNQCIGNLRSDIVKHLPNTSIHYPPRMMFGPDGVHLNTTDLTHFRYFLKESVVRQPAIFSRDSGRRTESNSYADSLGFTPQRPPADARAPQRPPVDAKPHRVPPGQMSPTHNRGFWYPPPSPRSQPVNRNLGEEITKLVVNELLQQNGRNVV